MDLKELKNCVEDVLDNEGNMKVVVQFENHTYELVDACSTDGTEAFFTLTPSESKEIDG